MLNIRTNWENSSTKIKNYNLLYQKYSKIWVYPFSQLGNKIYFWLRFGLANAINDYIKVKNSCCVTCREFLTFNAYLLNLSYKIWIKFIFVYQRSLKQTFKPVWICVLVLWIHKDYYVVKNWYEIFVLKLSGLQSASLHAKNIIYGQFKVLCIKYHRWVIQIVLIQIIFYFSW